MTAEIAHEPRFRNVMIIDDSETDRYIANHYLKKNLIAVNVLSVASAEEALEYLMQFANSVDDLPRFIFLDIRMPVMDGFDFLHEFRLLPKSVHQHCDIIMLSSSWDPQDHERVKNNPHVKKFISKPLTEEELNDLDKLAES